MKLKEFKYAKGNPVSKTPTQTVSNIGNASTRSSTEYKERFKKLFSYAYRHRYSEITTMDIIKLTADEVHFIEYYDTSNTVEYQIYVRATTEAWNLKIYTTDDMAGRKKVVDLSGMEWVNLLKELRNYIAVPVTGTPEYKSLLTEWVAMKNNSSTSPVSFKNRLKKLYDYLVKHVDKRFVERVELETLTDDTLRYIIYSTDLMSKVETRFIIRINPSTEAWNVRITGTTANANITGTGWEELLKNRNVEKSSSEYSNLLTESMSSIADDFKVYENLWD